jgi:coproporphyrinogen III oxidase
MLSQKTGDAMKQLILIIGLLCWLLNTAWANEDERLARLPAEQQKIAAQMIEFMDRMDAKYFARIEALNGRLDFEGLITDTAYSSYDIQVARGPVIEKAGRMISAGKKTSPGRGDSVLAWSRFYSIDIHPKTPLVGMLHAAIVMQFFEDGRSFVGGWMGILPGTRIEEDLQALKLITNKQFEKYNKDPEIWRRAICEGTQGTVAEFRRRPACSGVSLYAQPVFPGDTEQSYVFAAELFDVFIDGFLNTVEKRATDSFTVADVLAQDEMRKRWLVDQLFSDPFSSKIVPFKIWSFANVPPVIKF